MRISGRQLAVLQVLREKGEATVAEVQEALSREKPVAYTTVATLLSRMKERGVVSHRAEGRTFYYRPVVSGEEVKTGIISDLIERVFDGSAIGFVNHVLETQDVDPKELAQIKKLVAQREAAAGEGKKGGRSGR